MKTACGIALALGALVLGGGTARAATIGCNGADLGAETFLLQDGGSCVELDFTNGISEAQAWFVNGTNHLFTESFLLSVDGAAATDFSALGAPSSIVQDTEDAIQFNYNIGNLGISVNLALTHAEAGGQTISTIDESITFALLSGEQPALLFFEYTDFDLAGGSGGDSGSSTADTLAQSDGDVTATVVALDATTGFELELCCGLLDGLLDGSITGLSNAGGPLEGDLAHAFQWDIVFPDHTPGSIVTVNVNKRKTITVGTRSVPEPATLALLGLGALGLAGLRRRRR